MENHTAQIAVYSPHSETSHLVLHPISSILYGTAFCFLALVGFFGNILLITAILCCKTLKTEANILILNLAVTDLVLSAVVDTSGPANLFLGHGDAYYQQHATLCGFFGSVCLISCGVSVGTVMVISLNRYVCICHNNLYGRFFTTRNTLIGIPFIWLVGLAPHIAILIGVGRYSYDGKYLVCVWDRLSSDALSAMTTGLFFVSILAVTVCYILIFRTVRRSKKRINTSTNKQTAQSTADMRLTKMLFATFLTLLVLCTPYLLVVVLDQGDTYPIGIHMVAAVLFHVNSATNWIVYGVLNKNFRCGYKKVLRCISTLKLTETEITSHS